MKKFIQKAAIILVSVLVLVLISSFAMKPKIEPLQNQLNTIESLIKYRDSISIEVSQVNVAWHLDHMLITINEIYKVMDTSKPENYTPRFNVGRTMMFTFNKIPRGRAQSPQQVRPPEIIVTDSIYKHLQQARKYIALLDSLPNKAHFIHPYIGVLNPKRTRKFLKIHTNHHLEIISDILNQ